MKYSVKDYSQAFAAAASSAAKTDEGKIIKNFLALVRRNGDAALLRKITEEAARLLRAKAGIRKVVVETARPLTARLRQELKVGRGKDIVEEKVDASLVAGVRVTVEEERQFDGSLARKLQRMFAG